MNTDITAELLARLNECQQIMDATAIHLRTGDYITTDVIRDCAEWLSDGAIEARKTIAKQQP